MSKLNTQELDQLLEALDLLEEATEELVRARVNGANVETRLALTKARRCAREAVVAVWTEAATR